MNAAHDALPEPLRCALDACRLALDARPWEMPGEALQDAITDALGPVPVRLPEALASHARSARRELANAEVLAVAPDAPLAARIVEARERTARARIALTKPASLAIPQLEVAPDEWPQVFSLADHAAAWPGLRRRGVLAWRCAQSVLPMWLEAHGDDERAAALVDDIEPAITGAAREGTLRDALEREAHPRDPALSALRAIVLAHDLVTQSEARVEHVPLAELCAYAWLDALPELVPHARSHEPTARAEAWFRWWLAEAVPAAWRAG